MRLYSVPLVVFVVGISLSTANRSVPHDGDDTWRARVRLSDSTEFYRAQAANVTRGSELWHTGVGLTVLGSVLVLGFALLRVRNCDGLRTLHTPGTKGHLFVLTHATVSAFVPATGAWLRYTFNRGDYPPWGDSIALPMFGYALLVAILLPSLHALMAACLWRSHLPAPLWLRPRSWPGWTITVLAIPLIAWMILQLGQAVRDGNGFAIPLWLSAFYLVACARAAAATTKQPASVQSVSALPEYERASS